MAAAKFAEANAALIQMVNHAGRAAVGTQKSDAAQHPFGAEQAGQKFLVAQAVLQGEDAGLGPQQRFDQFREVRVCEGFEPHQHQVDLAHGGRVAKALHLLEVEVPRRRGDPQALIADGIMIAAQKKPHLLAAALQQRPVIKAQGSRPDDADFHVMSLLWVADRGPGPGRGRDEHASRLAPGNQDARPGQKHFSFRVKYLGS